jgi:transcriptional regulator with XRE-family HTH domain
MDEEKREKTIISSEYLAECLRIAREASGKTVPECSRLLGISTSRLRNYESGRLVPSLPEIESLSFIYNVPLPALLDPQLLSRYIHNPDAGQLKQLLLIRQEIIATRIQLAREKSGKTINEIAKAVSIPSSRFKKYENSEIAIPLNDLTHIADAIDLDLGELLDRESPIGSWQVNQEDAYKFNQLSGESRAFALADDNQPFIAFTQKLKALGLDNFERLSESIQQILETFHQK